jgi:hypothetical protein
VAEFGNFEKTAPVRYCEPGRFGFAVELGLEETFSVSMPGIPFRLRWSIQWFRQLRYDQQISRVVIVPVRDILIGGLARSPGNPFRNNF